MASIFDDDDLQKDTRSDGEYDKQNNEFELFGEINEIKDVNEDSAQQVIKVEPKKRSVRNPRPRLTIDALRGQRGIHTIEDYFNDIKFKGSGCEKQDLNEILRRLQHWGHRMYPTYKFDDILTNIERLGKKQALQLHMNQYRLGQLKSMKSYDAEKELADIENCDNNDDVDEPYDEFDALLGEQIAISKLDTRTPVHTYRQQSGHHTSTISSDALATPSFTRHVMSTPYSAACSTHPTKLDDTGEQAHPLPSSQLSKPAAKLTSEQMARIAENRRLALQRLREKQLQVGTR